MIRTQIYITEEEKKGIESVTMSRGINQSEFIRQAIDELLTKTIDIDKSEILDEIAGIWSDRKEIPDIRDLRTGWRNRTMR
jgi:Arc/MetJ-type ribon-helix-helix transcriptional regulator